MPRSLDAVVLGAGPNGLAAAIELAKNHFSVTVIEGAETIGGGTRSGELVPGAVYDLCSAIHPTAVASPFFSQLPLGDHGLEWIRSPVALAHPLSDGTAARLVSSLDTTADGLQEDGTAYRKLLGPLVANWPEIAGDLLAPFQLPAHPLQLMRFGIHAVRSAQSVANGSFRSCQARALFAGLAAHSFLSLRQSPSAAFGMILGALGHVTGWPFPRGGAQKIADAMAAYLQSLGGEIVTGRPIQDLSELPEARAYLLDVTPRQLLKIAGSRLSGSYRRQLENYRYGPGVFKIDYLLSQPVPWQAESCRASATLHLGGTFAEIADAEDQVCHGAHPQRPFVLVAQQSVFDLDRCTEGREVLWAYTHVPNGSTVDMATRIEDQVERFAPGFKDTILHRKTTSPAQLEARNPNCVGGDINGGLANLRQLFARPALKWNPYSTPLENLFLCSSSTPPGGGVHGMCGYHAARSVVKYLRKR